MSDDVIVALVEQLQRTLTGNGGVFPWQVMYYAPFEISEGYTRQTMVRLWRAGRLRRIGGENSRQGYVVAQIALAGAVVADAEVAGGIGRLMFKVKGHDASCPYRVESEWWDV